MQQQAAELDARLAAARHTARSAEQPVTAVVTGQGKLVDLRIDDRALYGAHAQKLGLAIVEAVRNARNEARTASLPQLNALFGKPSAPPPATGLLSQQRPVAPEPVRRPVAQAQTTLGGFTKQATALVQGNTDFPDIPEMPGNSGMDNEKQWRIDPTAVPA